jgi:hypothetical protein
MLFGPSGPSEAETQRRADEQARLTGVGFKLLHRAAEAVRLACLDESFSRAELRKTIHGLLDSRLREIMKARLGNDTEYSETVKWRRGLELVSVYRDDGQAPTLRPEGEAERLEGHYFSGRFEQQLHQQHDMRCLVVHNTEDPVVPLELTLRARRRGYSSCLAIPT